MIVILEGPDGGGKSTLAAKLSAATGWPVVHRGAPKTEDEKRQMMSMYEQVIREGADVIFDRCWYSELVYGPVMRDEATMGIVDMYYLEQLIVSNGGGIIVHCTDEPETLWERCISRGEDYITSYDVFMDIYRGYDRLLNSTSHLIPVVCYVADN